MKINSLIPLTVRSDVSNFKNTEGQVTERSAKMLHSATIHSAEFACYWKVDCGNRKISDLIIIITQYHNKN